MDNSLIGSTSSRLRIHSMALYAESYVASGYLHAGCTVQMVTRRLMPFTGVLAVDNVHQLVSDWVI